MPPVTPLPVKVSERTVDGHKQSECNHFNGANATRMAAVSPVSSMFASRGTEPVRHGVFDKAMLRVWPSQIPGAGQGLFTTAFIAKGTVVGYYHGRVLCTVGAMRLEDKSYLMRLGTQTYVDSKHTSSCFVRFINDPRNPLRLNVEFVKKPQEMRADVVALRDIQPGEELFASYGKFYWTGNESRGEYCRDIIHELDLMVEPCMLPWRCHQHGTMLECFHGAKYLAKVLESIGCEIKLYRPKEELNPVVLGRLGDVPDKPTITFYGHYDVQPAQEHDWCSNPFEMKAVDGFLYGRGTSDNKGPVLSFIYALKELLQEGRRQGGGGAGGGGELPLNFAFIIEGEEENGSRGIREALEPNLRWFRNTQLIVISNSQWVGDSAPCLTCGMRGQINVSVRVAGPERDLHSGNEGGVFNEPMSDLVKILDNLVDSRNTIRVPGFYDNTRENLVDAVMPGLEGFEQEFSVQGYQRALGVPGLTCGSSLRDLLEARWCRPSLSIVDLRMGHGIQVPSSPTSLLSPGLSTHDADTDSMAALYRFGPTRYSVIPRSATGMLSIRFVPDQDPQHLVACLQDHITHQYRMLRSANHLDVQVKSVGHYWQVDTGCKLFQAAERAVEREWGVKPLHVMEGGTMPCARLLEQLLQAPALMLPLGQSSDNCHLANERIRRVNLYHGKNVFKHLIDEVAQLHERGELMS